MSPATAKIPAIAASMAVVDPGSRSPDASPTASMIAAPRPSTTTAMPRIGARRPVQPPPKSPAPQAIADASPKTTPPRPGPAASAVGGPDGEGHAFDVVDLGRSLEGDDRVGRGVVSIRRR